MTKESKVFLEPKNLNELHSTFNHWLYLEDPEREAFEVVLVTALDRDIPGDPIWFYLIAPPGGIKTEFLRSLNDFKLRIYTLDSLTAATFISGKMEKDEDGELYPVAGILEDLDGKVLIIKDFTVVLSDTEQTRHAIFGQLRAIYDGYLEKGFGTTEPIRVHSKIGLIAGVTPVIDKYTKAHSILGERFLKIRLHPNRKLTSERAFKNLGKEEQMRSDLTKSTAYFLKSFALMTKTFPKVTKEQTQKFLLIADFVSLMRTRVFCRYFSGRITNMNITEAEIPTRLAKQLKKLALGLTLIRNHKIITKTDITTIQRVAKDCTIPNRLRIIESLSTFNTGKALGFQIAKTAKLPLNTTKNELSKMVMLNIIEEQSIIDENDKELVHYSMTKEFRESYDAVYK